MQRTHDYVKRSLSGQKLPLLVGPLLVIVHYRLPSPKSVGPKRRNHLHLFPHIIRPDGDNLEKYLNDALTGLIWGDDSRICWLIRSKTYTKEKEGSTIIFVKEIAEDIPNYAEIIADIVEHIKIEGTDDNAGQSTDDDELPHGSIGTN